MIALLENEIVNKKKWIDSDEFMNMVGISESTPGSIAVNAATYVGYKVAGITGAIVATLAVCLPSFAIIFIISLFYEAFLSFKYVAYAFEGIQICVIFLIMRAGFKLLQQLHRKIFNYIILAVTIGCTVAFSIFEINFSSVYYILISGGAAVVLYLVFYIRTKRKKEATQRSEATHIKLSENLLREEHRQKEGLTTLSAETYEEAREKKDK